MLVVHFIHMVTEILKNLQLIYNLQDLLSYIKTFFVLKEILRQY